LGEWREVQEIERAFRGLKGVPLDMDIACGGVEGAVSQEALNGAEVDAGFQQVGGEAVAEGVEAAAFANAGSKLGLLEDGAGR
jgi:hypothetical protein